MTKERLTLQNIVEAIMNSIADAQEQIERQTVDNINEWFDIDGRPKTRTFKVPSLHPNHIEQYQQSGELIERDIKIPLLTLMQMNPIKIKKLVTKFDVSLGGVDIIEEGESENSRSLLRTGGIKKIKKILSTELFTGSGKKSRQASMEIEFESSEPTEAYSRLQHELLKLF